MKLLLIKRQGGRLCLMHDSLGLSLCLISLLSLSVVSSETMAAPDGVAVDSRDDKPMSRPMKISPSTRAAQN